ncbi:bifunctional 3'-5' exonuclease/DNA polymerase [uncultured Friedmanniella sp.]|uniref:bifunctional 3'-5' exonuclease/DNA polymerase n=1 Tax=uncultured Friedmanniella sp. TaxID=335381 RepID=UPI0035CAADA9
MTWPDAAAERWRRGEVVAETEPTLLELPAGSVPVDPAETLAELVRQQQAVASSTHPDRLRLLLAAESTSALLAAELSSRGLPFDESLHGARLVDLLGPKPLPGGRPVKLEALAVRVRAELDAPGLNPDSPPELLRALRVQGIAVESTRQGELEQIDHPVVAPLLQYKQLARLLGANGWGWMAGWVRGDRFRPDYVPSGVVTGRWATRGGGALSLPKQIRAAVVAPRGCRLVVADAAQLEPRVLAAMARDEAMARASRRGDLYQALVDEGVMDTRAHAKVAMLGALYGATSGEAGHLMPRLLRTFPAATGLVEEAARSGERGGVVTTWLGRTSPPPPESWQQGQRRASLPEATAADQRRARSAARDWGRFTRNFVVQGTAAEWAAVWLAVLRRSLAELGDGGVDGGGGRPALVYFLHDEVIVETPTELAEAVADAVRAAARSAGELLFGRFPVAFELDVSCVQSYAEAG